MASEPKTRPTDASVDDFLAASPPARQADAAVVRDLLAEIAGAPAVMWGPSIVGFGSYSTGGAKPMDWPLLGFSPRKTELVLYFASDFPEREALLAKLGKHRSAVSCVYIKRLADVDLAVLRRLAQASAAWTRSGHASC
ncbi:DUF1801 domain-containing protein [Caulobacter endophyticus]|uniref:DUF1801 domain-containing protein n=1 Tax=Caulobacter endophyticus TaxID=2172652 RepID=UPI0024107A85|nr:DUF1801 domain-containing protein [Caulobacter endophyticus]MDG2527610.1 DUF1801 domain-containing protein [Caulobacter endophyticus]